MPGKRHRGLVVFFHLRTLFSLVVMAAVAPVSQAATIVFTNDVAISSTDTNYDGMDIVVTNCTVTVDGTHAFASLRVLSGGILTHSVSTGHTGLNLTTSGDVWVDENGAINADGKGYILSEGLGNGSQSGSPATGRGAGHGGVGGTSSGTGFGGASYGLAQQPSHKGSTGGLGGGSGGGALRLIVGGAFVLNGSLSANGNPGITNRSGGGSGGSVWLTAQSISGDGVISANGGSGEFIYGNGGGGGRVAIECETNTFVGSIMAHGGAGAQAGGAGTVYIAVTGANARLSVDNNGRAGANTPVQIDNACDLAVSDGATVIFPGALTVGNLFISSNGWLTIPANVSPGASVNLTVTGNVTIASQSGIIADARGYPTGQGPGRGAYTFVGGTVYGTGGGYGGQGGMAPPNLAAGSLPRGNSYGSIYSPADPGSGGGGVFSPSDGSFGSPGGGAVRLSVGGALLLDGVISANGAVAAPEGGGGGSGGSIWLTVGAMAGSGSISANGGNANPLLGGGGGGGRIAIYYSTNLFTGGISAHGGDGANAGGAGTIYSQPSGESGHVLIDNGGRNGTTPLMIASGTQDVTIGGGAIAQLTGAPFRDLLVKSSSWLSVPSLQQQGALFLTVTRNATIEPGAGIVADGKGYPAGQGPGGGGFFASSFTNSGGGGGHGGYGGAGLGPNARGGNAYGSLDSPNTPGSGGGGFSTPAGGAGGGVIQLNVNGTLRLDGAISADGGGGVGVGGGGGAGGSIAVRAGRLTGSGIFSANGGDANGPNGGGGGGGRIAIQFSTNDFSGAITAYGGGGANIGGAGTIYVKPLQLRGQVLVDNGGRVGTNTFITPGTYDLTVGGGGKIGMSQFTFAGDILIKSNGWMVLTSPFGGSMLRVIGNARIEQGGGIVGDGIGSGPGRGFQSSFGTRGGGGHGGYGGANPAGWGAAYGSIQSPRDAGGPGGSASGSSFPPVAGLGGGALQITVTGSFAMDGEISADGGAGEANSGGGAGGSVWLTAETLAGSGIISANGGAGNGTAGGGGGGRIAIYCNTNLFAGSISASGGAGSVAGGAGTIYSRRLNEPIERLLVDNGGRFGTNTPLQNLSAAVELTVRGGAAATVIPSFVSLSNLLVGFGSSLSGSAMNSDLSILGDAVIEAGGAISVDGKGYTQLSGGPGAGRSGSGAGYGGAGGDSPGAPGGLPYGSAERPTHAGSAGGVGLSSTSANSQGGGALRLTVGRALTLEGRLGADGNPGLEDNSGGGSGGSIWVMAGAIKGDGIISANGGAGEPSLGGGGGGGRIALYSLTNTFTGVISVRGGEGGERGQNGTIYTSTNLPVFEVVSQQPTGTVTNVVSNVDLVFSSPFNPHSASASDVIMTTPNGELATSNLAVFALSPSTLRISFSPPQSAVGDYTITIGPQIEDLFGQPMSQIHTGAFSILLQVIQGIVLDTNGQAVAGVMLQPTSELPPAFTDGRGEYTLSVPTGWSGSVTPSLDGFMFVPGSRVYTNINASIGDQDYLIVNTIAPSVGGQLQGTNLSLNWQGIPGVAYQPFWSTNLVNWFPYGSLLVGSNGVMQLIVPVDDDPMKFFRVRSEN